MIKYNKDGQAVSLVREIEGGYLVKHCYETDFEGFPVEDLDISEEDLVISDTTIFVEELYEKPLTVKYANEVKELQQQAATLENQIDELRSTKREEERLLNKINKFPIVKMFADYLCEQYTHKLFTRDLQIVEKNKQYHSSYVGTYLSKNQEWYLFSLRNDSYLSSDDTPFLIFNSFEEAQQKAKQLLIDRMNAVKDYNYKKSSNLRDLFNKVDESSKIKHMPDIQELYDRLYTSFAKVEDEKREEELQKKIFEASEALDKLRNQANGKI